MDNDSIRTTLGVVRLVLSAGAAGFFIWVLLKPWRSERRSQRRLASLDFKEAIPTRIEDCTSIGQFVKYARQLWLKDPEIRLFELPSSTWDELNVKLRASEEFAFGPLPGQWPTRRSDSDCVALTVRVDGAQVLLYPEGYTPTAKDIEATNS